jgi:hypothetical protein
MKEKKYIVISKEIKINDVIILFFNSKFIK